MSPVLREPARETPVDGSYDVIVAGGGIAGISAALSAARAGARTLLLEREYLLGGLATLGLVVLYLPLCDGLGQQVSFGICQELLELSASLEHPDLTAQWRENPQGRLEYTFNPNVFALLAEQLLLQNGVELCYGAQLCDVIRDGPALSAVVVETRSGRCAMLGRSFVDTTGDAVLCRLAGEDTALFRQGNILASWYFATEQGRPALQMLGFCDAPDKYKTDAEKQAVQTRYTGLEHRELTRFMLDSHRAIWEAFTAGGPSPERQLTLLPTIPQIRMTRRLAGVTEPDEPEETVFYSDSIGMIGNWKRPGPVYELPFSCLYGRKVPNLITAGRCISVTDTMWDNTRVIPACAVTGEAAGLAAALSDSFSTFSVSALQNALRRRGIPLHRNEIT